MQQASLNEVSRLTHRTRDRPDPRAETAVEARQHSDDSPDWRNRIAQEDQAIAVTSADNMLPVGGSSEPPSKRDLTAAQLAQASEGEGLGGFQRRDLALAQLVQAARPRDETGPGYTIIGAGGPTNVGAAGGQTVSAF